MAHREGSLRASCRELDRASWWRGDGVLGVSVPVSCRSRLMRSSRRRLRSDFRPRCCASRAVHAGRLERRGGAGDSHRFGDQPQPDGVVENKPGGGGNIAYSYVAKSPPEGDIMLIVPARSPWARISRASSTIGSPISRGIWCRRTVCHGRAGCSAGADGRGLCRAGKRFAGASRASARSASARRSTRRRVFQDACRRRSRACAVPRRHGGHAGSACRAHRHVHWRHHSLPPLIRTAACAPSPRPASAHRLVAGRADARRGGLSWLRGRLGGWAGGAGRHAARVVETLNREIAASSPRRASTSAWPRSASMWSAPAGGYAKFISDDYANGARWSPPRGSSRNNRLSPARTQTPRRAGARRSSFTGRLRCVE